MNETPRESKNYKVSLDDLEQTSLTPEQKEEVRQARLKAIGENANKRLDILQQNISENTKKELDKQLSDWRGLVEEKTMVQKAQEGIKEIASNTVDTLKEMPVIWSAVSAISSPVDTAEAVVDKGLAVMGVDSDFVVNNGVKSVFQEKWVWEGIKYLFEQIKTIFTSGISLNAFSRLWDLLAGKMNTGKKVSEIVSHYYNMLSLTLSDQAVWKNAMLDKNLLDIPLQTLRSHMNEKKIADILKLESISSGDAQAFLKKFFDANNFDKITSDYKSKASISEIDESTVTLKDIFLKTV